MQEGGCKIPGLSDIHYCLPAECTSCLSMWGCSILYPGPIHAEGGFQVFPGGIEFQ